MKCRFYAVLSELKPLLFDKSYHIFTNSDILDHNMASGPMVKFGWLVAGLVVGAAVAVGVMELVAHMAENVSSEATNSTTNSTGTRVQDSLQFLVVVSRLPFWL